MPRAVGVEAGPRASKNRYVSFREFSRKSLCEYRNVVLFAAVHLYALVGLCFVEWSAKWIALLVFTYYSRMFGITGGYHRYFSHKAFKTGRVMQFLLAVLGAASMQKGVLWWASHHRHHHKHSDQEDDVHSPTRMGFVWAHCGWFLLSNDHAHVRWEYIPDLLVPELLWLERNFMAPGAVLSVLLTALGGYPAFFWGFIVSTVLVWHGTFTINSLSHVYGSRRYATSDTSRNNFWLSLVTMGEGWHNNHHAYMFSASNGFHWFEWDPTYYTLYALSLAGLVHDLRPPAWDYLRTRELCAMPKGYVDSPERLGQVHRH
mmetsp:Transcript_24390/g.61146  ORF Transcript_24390/g.61146 Transcript_24390/m.61146 type:complete len:317 (+) Transcript_24390:98-1048(+)